MDYLKGDILWQIDVDEFFFDYNHLEIPNLFFNRPSFIKLITIVSFYQLKNLKLLLRNYRGFLI